MTRTYCVFAMLLACSACSTPGPSAPQSAPAVARPSSKPAARAEEPVEEMGIEARAVLNKLPASGSAQVAASLKPRYPDKAALLADIQTSRPVQAVVLDGNGIWPGFGPPLAYHTSADGSINQ